MRAQSSCRSRGLLLAEVELLFYGIGDFVLDCGFVEEDGVVGGVAAEDAGGLLLGCLIHGGADEGLGEGVELAVLVEGGADEADLDGMALGEDVEGGRDLVEDGVAGGCGGASAVFEGEEEEDGDQEYGDGEDEFEFGFEQGKSPGLCLRVLLEIAGKAGSFAQVRRVF